MKERAGGLQDTRQENKGLNIQKVVVVGSGVLGSQIAFQAAYKGIDVTI